MITGQAVLWQGIEGGLNKILQVVLLLEEGHL